LFRTFAHFLSSTSIFVSIISKYSLIEESLQNVSCNDHIRVSIVEINIEEKLKNITSSHTVISHFINKKLQNIIIQIEITILIILDKLTRKPQKYNIGYCLVNTLFDINFSSLIFRFISVKLFTMDIFEKASQNSEDISV
jgi:hypothetical protein